MTTISNPKPERFSKYQHVVIVILAVLQFLVILDFMIISPLGYILTKELEISTRQFGIVVSAYIFSAAISGVICAGVIDKYDRKKVLIFFFTGFTLGTMLCGFANSFTALLVGRIIAGIFGGVVSSIIMAIVADLFMANQRGRAMSYVQLAFAASQIGGIPLGLLIAERLSWQFSFASIVIISLVVLILIMLLLRPLDQHLKPGAKTNAIAHLLASLSVRNHQVGFAAVTVLGMSMMVQPFVSIYLVNNVHVSQEKVPLIFMVTGACAFFIMPIVGRLSDAYDKFNVFLFGSIMTCLIIPIYTHLPIVPLPVVIFMNVAMFAAVMSRMGPFQALNLTVPQPSFRGAYLSLSSSLQQLAGGIGIVIASSIVHQPTPTSPLINFDLLGYVVALLSLCAVYLVHRVKRISKRLGA